MSEKPDLGEVMRRIAAEDDLREARRLVSGLRNIIGHALCAICGDEIGEDSFGLDDDDHLAHQRCIDD